MSDEPTPGDAAARAGRDFVKGLSEELQAQHDVRMLHRDYKSVSEWMKSGEPLSPEDEERIRTVLLPVLEEAEARYMKRAQEALDRNPIHQRNLAKLRAGELITMGEILEAWNSAQQGKWVLTTEDMD